MWYVLVAVVAADLLVLAGVLVRMRSRRDEEPAADADVLVVSRPAGLRGRERQLLTIEIIDPGEVAASRGRALGLVGTFAPALVRRVVYDRTRRTLSDELTARGVRADVRLHTLRAGTAQTPPSAVVEVPVVDAPPPMDL